MLESKRDLIGSPYNDHMKWLRKQDPENDKCYAADLDICLMSFNPPGIVAAIDYKQDGEKVTRTEEVLYKTLHDMGIPVYIVCLEQELYYVLRYNPDTQDMTYVLHEGTEEDYWKWEKELRRKWISFQRSKSSIYSRPKGNWRGVASTNEQLQA